MQVTIEFSDPAAARSGFDRLTELIDRGDTRLLDLEFLHSIDGVASTIPAGRVDKHLARFDHASAGLLDREELDAVAANLPHGSTAAVLSYEGEPPVDAIEAWTAAGVRVVSGG